MPTTKTIEVTTYQFDELSDRAKDKARDWYQGPHKCIHRGIAPMSEIDQPTGPESGDAMNAGKSYDKAKRQAKANANVDGRPRLLHRWGDTWWIDRFDDAEYISEEMLIIDPDEDKRQPAPEKRSQTGGEWGHPKP